MIEWVLLLIAAAIVYYFFNQNKKLREDQQTFDAKYDELNHTKKSQSAIYGKSIEQFSPFMHNYPYEKKNFRFIGTPIDGFQFNFMPNEIDDEMVVIEVKGRSSQLTERERRVKSMIERGHVRWEEIRIN